jgi:hypothetical protein
MLRTRIFLLGMAAALLVLGLASSQTLPVTAATNIFASPVQASCYLARHDVCKIHVEPFTIDIASGQKLVKFQLITIQGGTGTQHVIYDFRPDVSNPVPFIGNTFTPSLVAKDFAATCGRSYEVSLQGQDSGDASMFNLGLTAQFTCPTGTYLRYIPSMHK